MAAAEKEKRQQAAALQIEFSIFVLVPKGPQRNFSQNQKQCSFHGSGKLRSELVLHSLTGPRAGRGAGGEGARAHAEARAERRGNVAEGIAAAGAVAVAAQGSGGIGAEPAAAGRALRIDTLHSEARQKLHFFSLSGGKAQADSCATARPSTVSRPRQKKF